MDDSKLWPVPTETILIQKLFLQTTTVEEPVLKRVRFSDNTISEQYLY